MVSILILFLHFRNFLHIQPTAGNQNVFLRLLEADNRNMVNQGFGNELLHQMTFSDTISLIPQSLLKK